MVQHIRKKHPEFAQLANTIQAPLATAVISSTPAVISTDGATAEAVVVSYRPRGVGDWNFLFNSHLIKSFIVIQNYLLLVFIHNFMQLVT